MSCPKCVEGYELPGEPKGSIQAEFQGAYFTAFQSPDAGSSGSNASKRAVVLLTDGFGLPLKNCKIIADKISTALECDVWVPDYFQGMLLSSLELCRVDMDSEWCRSTFDTSQRNVWTG